MRAVGRGDLGDWGHPTDYPAAVQFLREVCVALAVPLQPLFVIPGNHDIDRTRQSWWSIMVVMLRRNAGWPGSQAASREVVVQL
jgi:DNA repair exonuclease SbcCD nuclease subunit